MPKIFRRTLAGKLMFWTRRAMKVGPVHPRDSRGSKTTRAGGQSWGLKKYIEATIFITTTAGPDMKLN